MAVALSVVRATLTEDQEPAFGKWYHEARIPDLLKQNGAVSARRQKKLFGPEKSEQMLQYEVVSQEAFGSFKKSDHLEALKADCGRNFGSKSKRDGISYVQVRP